MLVVCSTWNVNLMGELAGMRVLEAVLIGRAEDCGLCAQRSGESMVGFSSSGFFVIQTTNPYPKKWRIQKSVLKETFCH